MTGDNVNQLVSDVNKAYEQLKIVDKQAQLAELQQSSSRPDFWQDNTRATEQMQKITEISSLIDPWVQLKKEVDELTNLEALNDKSLETEISQQLKTNKNQYNKLKQQLKFNGSMDLLDAVLVCCIDFY